MVPINCNMGRGERANILGLDSANGFMANHVEGERPWNLLVEAARAAEFAIMPVGCPVCVPSANIADHLPPELVAEEGVRVVNTGRDLLAVIRG